MADNEELILHKKAETGVMPLMYTPYPVFLPYHVPAHDIKVSKPDGIFNKAMFAGAVIAGGLALLFGAELAAFAASTIAGGLVMGIVGEITSTRNYNLALQQKSEREEQKQPEQSKSVGLYKNISDLEPVPTKKKDGKNKSFEEEEKRKPGAAAAQLQLIGLM